MTARSLRTLTIRLVGVIVALAGVQLALSGVFAQDYANWFRSEHPGTPDIAVYVGLGLRALLAFAWLSSFRRFVRLVSARDRRSVWLLLTYSLVSATGYGYLLVEGGPWWLTAVHATQFMLALAVLALAATPAVRRAFGPAAACPESARRGRGETLADLAR